MELNDYLNIIFNEPIYKMVISDLKIKSNKFKKIIIERKKEYYLSTLFTDTQSFNEKITFNKINDYLIIKTADFKQINFWSQCNGYMIKITEKGKVIFNKTKSDLCKDNISLDNDRKKNYLIKEGEIIPPLVDMGIFSPDGKVITSMYDKFKQINRFIEIIDDYV